MSPKSHLYTASVSAGRILWILTLQPKEHTNEFFFMRKESPYTFKRYHYKNALPVPIPILQ